MTHLEELARSKGQLCMLQELAAYQPNDASATLTREPVEHVSQPHILKSLTIVSMPITIIVPRALFPFVSWLTWPASYSTQKTLYVSCFYAVEFDVVTPSTAFKFAIVVELRIFQKNHHHRCGSSLARYLALPIDPQTFLHHHLHRLLPTDIQLKMAVRMMKLELGTMRSY